MKRMWFLAVLPLCVALGGCPATINTLLNITPQQRANLQAWADAGKTVVQASATLFCEYEPTTSKLVSIFDASSNTQKTLGKIDAATIVLCNTALTSGAIVKSGA